MNEQITEEDEEQNIIAKIPVAEDVLYKKRQHLPGYPRWDIKGRQNARTVFDTQSIWVLTFETL